MTNPRYAAFVVAHGKRPNWEFMAFIQFMLKEFAETKGRTHTPLNPFGLDDDSHSEFTSYIEENSGKYNKSVAHDATKVYYYYIDKANNQRQAL